MMATSRQTHRAEGTGLGARARPRPGVMIVSALAILVVIGAIWIGFAAKSNRHANEPQILQPSAPNVVSEPATPVPGQKPAPRQ
jgi:hypothetical protein